MFLRLLIAFTAFGALAGAVAVALRDAGVIPAALLVALLAAGPAWYFARKLVRPFRAAGDAADRIARGAYDPQLDAGPWRECRDLAARFNEMGRRVAGRVGDLEAERQQLR